MKSISMVLMCSLALFLTACGGFLDVNDDPNNPVEANMSLQAQLPAALVASVNQECVQLNRLGAVWAGYWGSTTEGAALFRKEQAYNGAAIMAKRDGIPVWEHGFTTIMYYERLKERALREGAPFYMGIANIMQGWHYLRLSDVYGDIPFDEAVRGDEFPMPRYEDGRLVYRKAVDLISEGISAIKVAAVMPGRDDVLFNGRRDRWIQLANTIKLRALLRQSEAGEGAYIGDELARIAAEGSGFLSETAAVQPGYLNSSGKMNPFWEGFYRSAAGKPTANHQDIRPTQYAVDQYARLNDPRLGLLYAVNKGGQYRGVLLGNPNPDARFRADSTSALLGPAENGGRAGALLKSHSQASVLMGDFESLFLQAEAVQRGWIAGGAAQLYERAIEASCRYMEVPSAEIGGYLAREEVRYNGSLEQIMLQKWLALNSISSIEAWNDFRRLGLPAIPNSLAAPSPEARPLRLLYPETEVQTNGVQVRDRNVTDITKSPVWWNTGLR